MEHSIHKCPAFNHFMLCNLSQITELLFIKPLLPKNVLMTPLTKNPITYLKMIGGEMFEVVSLVDGLPV